MAYPSVYNGTIGLVDERGEKTYIQYSIDTPTNIPFAGADLTAAAGHITDLAAKLGALSNANIFLAELRIRVIDNATLGADGSDVSNEAVLEVFINPTGQLEKVTKIRIPSPLESLFELDKKTVDLENADLADYVDEVDAGVFLSDGEQINDALGVNGVKKGYWVSKSRRAHI